MSERRRGSLRGLIEPLPEPESGPRDSMFGPEPPEGWHRGIPGLRKQTPKEKAEWIERETERHGLTDEQREEWIAAGGYSAWLYTPRWTEDDEDSADAWGEES